MRTLLRFSALFMTLFLCFHTPNAQALIISTPVTITTYTIFNEDILIITGGSLTIAPGAAIELTAGYNIAVTSGGTLNLGNSSGVYFQDGTLYTTVGSTTTLAMYAYMRFLLGGGLHLIGGSITCNNAMFRGAAPTYSTVVIIDDGTVLDGTYTLEEMNVWINDNSWDIPVTSGCTIQGYSNIIDPTFSNSHYIDIQGQLAFTNGIFDINTVNASNITEIHVRDNAALKVYNSTVEGMPQINGDYRSYIVSNQSEWYVQSLKGVDSRGDIEMYQTLLDAFTPANGWNGIYLHDASGTLRLQYTRVFDVNTNTNDYAIYIARADAAQHLLENCTIAHPTTPNLGYGLHIEGSNTQITDCKVVCTYFSDFEFGIFTVRSGILDMKYSELTRNTVGCMFRDSERSYIYQSWIHENDRIGLYYLGAQQNELIQCNVHDNTNYEIYAEMGLTPPVVRGYENNIYNSQATLVYIIAAYTGSWIDLQDCWWDHYPPVIGIHFMQDATSTILFSWVWLPHLIDGYLTCGMVYPKENRARTAVSPVSADIEMHNYPNPFNPSTQIEFTLPESMHVILSVYALNGQRISTLTDDTYAEGTHTVEFTAPTSLSSGMYMYVLHTPYGSKQGMMMLTK